MNRFPPHFHEGRDDDYVERRSNDRQDEIKTRRIERQEACLHTYKLPQPFGEACVNCGKMFFENKVVYGN